MKWEIFVFSGTGNSLAVAKGLANALGDCELVSIPGALRGESPAARAPSVGLVFPLYFLGLPRVVLEFLNRVDLSRVSYLFAVVTRGGSPGCAAHLIRRALGGKKEKPGGPGGGRAPALDSAFYLRFWTNFIVRYRAPSERRRETLALRADPKLRKIVRIVEAKQKRARWEPLCLLALFVYRRFLARVNAGDSRFRATERCSSCGLCERICPVTNIRINGGRPVWLHRCELCLACLHFCPETAIEYGRRTMGKRRCRHPRVSAGDLVELKNAVRSAVGPSAEATGGPSHVGGRSR